MLCAVKADHSSRGVLPSVVCPISVIGKPRRGNATGGEGGVNEVIFKNGILHFRKKQQHDVRTFEASSEVLFQKE